MKQKQLLRKLLAAVCLLAGTSAWGAEPTLTLTSSYDVDNYAKLCYFDFGAKTIDDGSTYADVVDKGGYTESTTRGIQNQTSSSSTTPVTITKSVKKGDLIVIQAGQTGTHGMSVTVSSTVSNPIKNDGYYVYYVTADVASFTIKLNRLNYVRAMQILRPSNTTYVVNAVTSNGTFLKEIATGEYTADATVYYPYGIMKDGVCYSKAKNNNEPYWGFTNIAAGLRTIVYEANNWAYYAEIEDMNNASLGGTRYSLPGRASNGGWKWMNKNAKMYSTNLSAGIYSITVYGRNSKSNQQSLPVVILRNPSGNYTKTVAEFNPRTNANTESSTVNNVIIPDNYAFCLYQADNNSNIDLDYVYAVKTADVSNDVAEAIIDCETYETSTEFDTHIRGLLANDALSSAADVYAAHTAWQIAQADAASSNDITKVIRNAAVADATDWDGAGTYSGEQYTGAPDNTFIDNYGAQMWATQRIYGLPAGKYQVKVATRAHADNYSHVYVSNGSYDICSARGTHVGNGKEEGVEDDGELGNGWSWTYVPFEITETTNILLGFYKDAKEWAGADDWHLYKVTEAQPFEITSTSGWATLYTPYALDFSTLSESLTAYTATFDGSTVELKKVTDVPANTGVVLKGSKGVYNIPLAASSSTAQGHLKGSPTWATSYDSNYKFYYLALNAQNQAQFKLLGEGGSIAAGKAYLQINNSGNAKALSVVFANDPTGITNVNAAEGAKPAKRIVNGQFVIEKNGKRYNAAGAEF